MPEAEYPMSVRQTGIGPMVRSLTNAPVYEMGRAVQKTGHSEEWRTRIPSALSLSERAGPSATERL